MNGHVSVPPNCQSFTNWITFLKIMERCNHSWTLFSIKFNTRVGIESHSLEKRKTQKPTDIFVFAKKGKFCFENTHRPPPPTVPVRNPEVTLDSFLPLTLQTSGPIGSPRMGPLLFIPAAWITATHSFPKVLVALSLVSPRTSSLLRLEWSFTWQI